MPEGLLSVHLMWNVINRTNTFSFFVGLIFGTIKIELQLFLAWNHPNIQLIHQKPTQKPFDKPMIVHLYSRWVWRHWSTEQRGAICGGGAQTHVLSGKSQQTLLNQPSTLQLIYLLAFTQAATPTVKKCATHFRPANVAAHTNIGQKRLVFQQQAPGGKPLKKLGFHRRRRNRCNQSSVLIQTMIFLYSNSFMGTE